MKTKKTEQASLAPTAASAALAQCLIDVEDVTGVTSREILTRKRGYESTCLARFFVYAMMREHDHGFSLKQIGDVMGRDHGAVISGLKTLRDRLSWEKKLKARAKLLRAKGYAI